MTTRRLLLPPMLSVAAAVALAACASDPNKQVTEVRAAAFEAEPAPAPAESAEDRRAQHLAAAEVLRKRAAAAEADGGITALTDTTTADGGPRAEITRESAEADGGLALASATEARSDSRAAYQAKATARLEKADARMAALERRAGRAGAKASPATNTALRNVASQRDSVTRELDKLRHVGSDSLPQVKSNLDTELDALEGLLEKAAGEVAKLPR